MVSNEEGDAFDLGLPTPNYDPTDPPDVFSLECSTRKTLNLIASTWTVLVIHALHDRTLRYSELKSRIEGVTHKMLAQTLRALECDGLVERQVYPEVPPKVEYRLSSLGRTLVDPLMSLCNWAEVNYDRVEQSRRKHWVSPLAPLPDESKI